MTDPRWKALGHTLIHDSLGVKPGQKLMIAMHEIESYPLALAAYSACVAAGGYAQIQFWSEALKHQLLRHGTEAQIGWVPEIEAYGMEWADHYLALRGAFNLHECADIPPEKLALYQKAQGIISSLRWKHTNWTLVRVPNTAFAQQARMSYDQVMDTFFDACTLDWAAYRATWQEKAMRLNRGNELHLTGEETDFSFRYGGEEWVICDNKINVPDGEIFITPKWETVNGRISFDLPAVLGGKVVQGLSLTFKDGVVTEVNARENLAFVREVLAQNAPGSLRCGEFAFGTNPHIKTPTTDILWDEKMAGTVHIALGRPYNRAYECPLHWDIVKDTRQNGRVALDGELIFENGAFLI